MPKLKTHKGTKKVLKIRKGGSIKILERKMLILIEAIEREEAYQKLIKID